MTICVVVLVQTFCFRASSSYPQILTSSAPRR